MGSLHIEVIVEREGEDDALVAVDADACVGDVHGAIRAQCWTAGDVTFAVDFVDGCEGGKHKVDVALADIAAGPCIRVVVKPHYKWAAKQRLTQMVAERGEAMIRLHGAIDAADWELLRMIVAAEAYFPEEMERAVAALAKIGSVDGLRALHDAAGIDNDDVATVIERVWLDRALSHAAKEGHIDAVAWLAAAGTDVAGDAGVTALREAAYQGHADIVRLLLDARGMPAVGEVGVGGVPPSRALHDAAGRGHLDVVEALLAAGFCADAWDRTYGTPLHQAAENNHVDVVRLLLRHNARVDERTNVGRTPLHVAASRGLVEVARALAHAGADPFAQDSYGRTPSDLSCQLFTVRHRMTTSVLLQAELSYVPPTPAADDASGASPVSSPREGIPGTTYSDEEGGLHGMYHDTDAQALFAENVAVTCAWNGGVDAGEAHGAAADDRVEDTGAGVCKDTPRAVRDAACRSFATLAVGVGALAGATLLGRWAARRGCAV